MTRKRQRQPARFDPGDSDDRQTDEAQYPASLFKSADDLNAWVSPTKAVKKYLQPLKRRRQTNRRKAGTTSGDSEQGYRWSDDEGSEPMCSGLLSFGPSEEDHTGSEALPPGPRDIAKDPQVIAYAEAVDASVAVFQHIGNGIFVVQGWDARRFQPTVC